MKKYFNETTLFYLFLLIGIFLRVVHFPSNPRGLSGEEVAIGYEAFSLLTTSADRWGHHLPPYFLAWGSGQNTLYAYLSIPFIKLFGFNEFSVRVLSVLLGIVCIPMVYNLIKKLFANITLARMATILYLFDPYLFMNSRWANEINFLPFFIFLPLLIFASSLIKVNAKEKLTVGSKAIIISFFPSLALLFYSYAPSIFIVPLFILFVLLFYRKHFLSEIKLYAISAFFGAIIIAPFALFILKNNVLGHSLPFESSLPFTIPKMLSHRQPIFESFSEHLAHLKLNLLFIFSGFNDSWVYNSTNFEVPHLFLVFTIPALIYLVGLFRANTANPKNILLFWAIASFSVFGLYRVNLNRSLHFQTIIPVFIVIGMYFTYTQLKEGSFKRIIVKAVLVLFVLQSATFMGEYFLKFPKYNIFPKDVGMFIHKAEKAKIGDEKIAFTKKLPLNYVYVAFYLKYPPIKFQKEVKIDTSTDNVIVDSFGNYYMLGDEINLEKPDNLSVIETLKKEKSFLAVLRLDENPVFFNAFKQTEVFNDKAHDWKLVRYTKI